MDESGKSTLFKGFENQEFRRAVLSFLKEKCPEEAGELEGLSLNLGLEIIRQFIFRKRVEKEGALSAIAVS